MNWQELILRGKQILSFPDGTNTRLQWYYGNADQRVLRMDFGDEKILELPNVVDASEVLDDPRVFVLEGRRQDHVMLLGGEWAYCISSRSEIEHRFHLFRKDGFEEYWTTTLIDRGGELLIVYESGVVVIDDLFRVRLHKQKLINDVLSEVKENRLKLVRDHEMVWYMNLAEEVGTINLF